MSGIEAHLRATIIGYIAEPLPPLPTSPRTQAAFADMGAAMKDSILRYFAVEHMLAMLIAVVLIQMGRTLSKKAADDSSKHRKVAIYTGVALLIILISLAPKGLLFGTAATMAG